MVLGFEVWRLDTEDLGQGRLVLMRQRGKRRVREEDLAEAGGGERMLGGDVDGWAGETPEGGRKLGCQEEEKEELGFTGSAIGGDQSIRIRNKV